VLCTARCKVRSWNDLTQHHARVHILLCRAVLVRHWYNAIQNAALLYSAGTVELNAAARLLYSRKRDNAISVVLHVIVMRNRNNNAALRRHGC
jgi:hypothetical protein